jgi:hypothetical protein
MRQPRCGNDAPVDITERCPPELGNLAGEREIPTFPQRLVLESVDKNVGEKGTS